MGNTATIVGTLVCLAGLAAGARAQEPKPQRVEVVELKGDFERPLGAARQPERANTRSSMIMSRTENGRTTTVRIEDGRVTAEHDGRPVPADRVRQNGGVVEVLDDRGEVMARFESPGPIEVNVPRAARAPRDVVRPRLGLSLRGPGGEVRTWTPDILTVEHPKVMIGINMSDADPRLMEHLGLGKEGGVLVDDVIPDLAGAKAGLEPNDLIVAADNLRPLTQEGLRGLLRAKNPGDEITLKVVRKGAGEREIKVRLDAYEPAKLGLIEIHAAPDAPAEGQHGLRGEARRAIKEAMKALKGDEASKAAAQARKHLEEAMKQFEVMRGEWLDDHEFFNPEDLRALTGRGMRFFGEDGRGFMVPARPPAPLAPEGVDNRVLDRLEKLAERLEKLTERVEAIDRRLKSDGR
ncbi:MAG: PDZ domain-containing protein [Phycisphaeraceae bacterium]|nr:MAG: PDZ domain-containing protein [Phycisphaeraceae bacterium]